MDGDLSGFVGDESVNISDGSSLTVGGKVNVSGEIELMKSNLRADGDVVSGRFTAYQNCAVDIGGSLSAYGDISAMESTFSVAGSVKGSTVYLYRLPAAATVGGVHRADGLVGLLYAALLS